MVGAISISAFFWRSLRKATDSPMLPGVWEREVCLPVCACLLESALCLLPMPLEKMLMNASPEADPPIEEVWAETTLEVSSWKRGGLVDCLDEAPTLILAQISSAMLSEISLHGATCPPSWTSVGEVE